MLERNFSKIRQKKHYILRTKLGLNKNEEVILFKGNYYYINKYNQEIKLKIKEDSLVGVQ
jgi:hypothetical protein